MENNMFGLLTAGRDLIICKFDWIAQYHEDRMLGVDNNNECDGVCRLPRDSRSQRASWLCLE